MAVRNTVTTGIFGTIALILSDAQEVLPIIAFAASVQISTQWKKQTVPFFYYELVLTSVTLWKVLGIPKGLQTTF